MTAGMATVTACVLLSVLACREPTDATSTPVVAQLAVQSTALRSGDSTIVTITVRNITAFPVTYDVGLVPIDLSIEQAGHGELWRWSHQPRAEPATLLTIPAGGSMDVTLTLRIGGPVGPNLPVGSYRLRGFFVGSRREVIASASPVLDFYILP